ncbi:MAG TPA: GNAT family N-acetyltransferase [Actinomycetota bacterium]|nr:GNAT family N-acetyltransferase [Actinomycetota bacterium]
MDTAYDIRKSRANDVPAMAALLTELGYPTSPEQLTARLANFANVDGATLVCEHGGEVVGLIGLTRHPFYELDGFGTEVSVLVVTAARRGRGIGRALLDAAEAWAGERGSGLVWLASSQRRQDAHRFYERAEYRTTGLRYTKAIIP